MAKKADFKKVIITMPNHMVEYLETIGQFSRRTGGFKIAKTEIVRALIKVLKMVDINCETIQSEKEIELRILDALKAY